MASRVYNISTNNEREGTKMKNMNMKRMADAIVKNLGMEHWATIKFFQAMEKNDYYMARAVFRYAIMGDFDDFDECE